MSWGLLGPMIDLMTGAGLLLLLTSLAAGAWLLRSEALRASARARLDESEGAASAGTLDPSAAARKPGSRSGWPGPWVSTLVGFTVALACVWLGWNAVLASGTGAVAAILVHLGVESFRQRRLLQLEEGLAEAIGLASSALRAGASPVQALERAARAVRGPARDLLLDLTGRLRLGEEPAAALEELSSRAPVESFRLFSLALAVQWGAGGSLERSLAVVARSVRDRVELLRRIHTQSAPTRGSVFAFVAATVAIAWLMHQYDPGNLERFLRSEAGSLLVGGAVWLQAIGIWWMWRLSQVRV